MVVVNEGAFGAFGLAVNAHAERQRRLLPLRAAHVLARHHTYTPCHGLRLDRRLFVVSIESSAGYEVVVLQVQVQGMAKQVAKQDKMMSLRRIARPGPTQIKKTSQHPRHRRP